jgi:hypothetical protein
MPSPKSRTRRTRSLSSLDDLRAPRTPSSRRVAQVGRRGSADDGVAQPRVVDDDDDHKVQALAPLATDPLSLLQEARLSRLQHQGDAAPALDVAHDAEAPADDLGVENKEENKVPAARSADDLNAALEGHLAQLSPEYIDGHWYEMYRDSEDAADHPECYGARFGLIDAVSDITHDEASGDGFLSSKRKAAVLQGLADGQGLMSRTGRKDGIAEAGQALEGKLNWVNGGRQAFLQALGGQPVDDDTASMNCFEAVMYAGLKAGAVQPESIQAIYDKGYGQGDNRFGDEINGLLGRSENLLDMVATGRQPAPGDAIVFGDVETHVALSLGGNDVLSLWNQPDGVTRFQRTTITALSQAGHLDPLNVWVKTNPFA